LRSIVQLHSRVLAPPSSRALKTRSADGSRRPFKASCAIERMRHCKNPSL
jgi:hypothetical protein